MTRRQEIHSRLPIRLARWSTQLYAAEVIYNIDALDLAAIMDRESLGGAALKPPTPEGLGDNGNGHGLMQLDGRYHRSFLEAKSPAGTLLWHDPAFQILYAAKLLHVNLLRFEQHHDAAVAAYNASPARVREALNRVRVEVGETSHRAATPLEEREALDAVTTGGNYVSDVAKRRASFVLP